jgi:hypothetical protein
VSTFSKEVSSLRSPDSQRRSAVSRGSFAALGPNVIRRKWLTFLVCAIAFASLVVFAVRMTPASQLLLFVSMFAWFLALIGGVMFSFSAWKEMRFRALVPLGVCLITVPCASVVARGAMAFQFSRQLPSFERAVSEIKAKNIPAGTNATIPNNSALLVFAERTSAGQLQVEFVTGLGFPVKHSGYLYAENGIIEAGSLLESRWPYTSRVRPQWFHVSD